MPLITAVIAIVAAVLITALIVWNVAISYRKKVVDPRLVQQRKRLERLLTKP